MSLHPTMRRRLHERLHPLIGDEESDALLDEVSPADPVTREWLDDRFVTKAWLREELDCRAAHVDARFERIDERFEHSDQVVALKLEASEHRILGEMHQAFRQQTVLLLVLTSFLGGILALVQTVVGG